MGNRAGIGRRAGSRLARALGALAGHRASTSEGPLLLRIACESLLASGPLAVVQIGANDGLHNDPLNPVVRLHSDRMRLLLVEPQSLVLPHLRSTYSGHPAVDIVHAAIGPAGDLGLFVVDPAHWGDCQPGYATGWPAYRAPTGISSTSQDHVRDWLAKYYTGDLPVDELILRQQVTCMPLPQVLSERGFPPLDVLVVDTEGFDDEVLYHSDLETLRPAVVFFEHAHLNRRRRDALMTHLADTAYVTHAAGDDTLALRAAGPARGIRRAGDTPG